MVFEEAPDDVSAARHCRGRHCSGSCSIPHVLAGTPECWKCTIHLESCLVDLIFLQG